MKIVPKKQKGGNFLHLFADYAPMQPAASMFGEAAPTKQGVKESEDKGKLTEKDLYKMLEDVDGLPNEVDYLVRNATLLFDDALFFGNSSVDSQSLGYAYSQVMSQLKRANFNKKEYDNAYKQVEQNKGLNEAVITTGGGLLVYDENNAVKQISIKDYKNTPDKYRTISNSELLRIRAYDPQMVNDNTVFEVLNNGIGIEKIQQMIKERFQSLGSSDIQYSGSVSKVGKDVLAGVDVLKHLTEEEQSNMTLDGMYKAKIITKDQQVQAQKALEYIYSTLPANAQAVLALRSNEKEDLTKGALEVIQSLIQSKMSSTRNIELEYDAKLNADGSKKDSSGKGGKGLMDEDLNAAQMFLAGYGNKETFMINPGTNLSTAVTSNAMQLVKKDGTNLGTNCSLQEVSQGQFGGILDWSNVTMGGRKVDPSFMNEVLVSDGMVRSIDFPIDANGNPDLRPTTLEAKRHADDLIREAGIDIDDPVSIGQNYQKINEILEECGLSAAYNSDGKIIAGNWKRFAVMNGTADNRALGMDPLDNNMLLNEVTEDGKIDSINSAIEQKLGLKKGSREFDKNDSWWEGDYDMLLEGTIWVPLNVNYANAMVGSGKEMSAALNQELEARQIEMDRSNELRRRYIQAEQP